MSKKHPPRKVRPRSRQCPPKVPARFAFPGARNTRICSSRKNFQEFSWHFLGVFLGNPATAFSSFLSFGCRWEQLKGVYRFFPGILAVYRILIPKAKRQREAFQKETGYSSCFMHIFGHNTKKHPGIESIHSNTTLSAGNSLINLVRRRLVK